MRKLILKQFRALKTSENHWLRKAIGVLLVAGGLFGFLPVLGYWMLPLGLALLAVDFPLARRINRRLTIWWERKRRKVTGNGKGQNGRAVARGRNRANRAGG